jgi:accessory gene regulator B
MIIFLSNHLTNFLCEKKIIDEEQKPVYVYGFEIIISSLIGMIIVFSIGLVLGKLIEACIFYVIFVVTRTYTGGYHANSYFKCNMVFFSVYVSALILTVALTYVYNIVIHIMILVIYLSAVLGLSPMENVNKPMNEEERAVNRKKCIAISLFWCAMSLIVYTFSVKYAVLIALTLFSIAMLMIIEKFRKEEKSGE